MSYHRATEIRAAIERANLVETWEDGQLVGYVPTSQHAWAGTYKLTSSYVKGIGSFLIAERINEREGFEVAYQSILGGTDLNGIEEGDRFGYWYDEGIEYINRTIHLKGVTAAGVALDVARLYAQEAVYDWTTGQCVSTKDPATAL